MRRTFRSVGRRGTDARRIAGRLAVWLPLLSTTAASAAPWTATGGHSPGVLAGLALAALVGAGLGALGLHLLRNRRPDREEPGAGPLRRAILEDTPETVIATDRNRRIRVVNPAFTSLFGYGEDEVIGRPTRMLYANLEDYERVGHNYSRRLAERGYEIPIVTIPFRARDGRTFHGDTFAGCLFDDDGHHIGYVGFIRDASERVRAESEYRSIFDNVSEGLCRSTPDGRMVRANPALVRLFGFDTERKLLESVTDLGAQCYVHSEDRAEMLERLRRDGYVEGFEVEMIRPGTGERIWVSENARPIHDEAGELAYLDVSLNDITERKRVEEELLAQNERYRMLVETSLAILWEGDPETMAFTYVSPEAESLLGYPVERWTREPDFWVDHMHPEDRDWAPSYCMEATRDLRQHQFDYRMLAADGRVVWLRDLVTVVARHGRPVRNVGIMIDVTQEKETQRQLRVSEARYRQLFEANHAVMLLVDPADGVIVDGNEAAHRYYGFDAGTLRGRGVAEITTTARADLEREMARARVPTPESLRLRQRTAGGEEREVEIYSGPVDTEQGRVLYWIVHDVTYRVRADKRLREAATVFDNTADGIFMMDACGTVVDVNRSYTDITGYEAADVVGETGRVWDAGYHGPDFTHSVWRTVAEQGHWRGQVWIRHNDGSVFPAWLSMSRVRDGEGAAAGYVGVFSDFSEVKNAEARLDHLAHHDSLTDLPNRLLLDDRLDHAIRRAGRTRSSLALMFVDLDGFKHVNDSLGHHRGDALLREAAERLTACVRTDDTVARIGGDEFTLMIEAVDDRRGCVAVAEKIVAAFASPFDLDGQEIYVTPSIGIAICPEDAGSAELLLRNADAAMYQAKHEGGNTFAFYTRRLTTRAHERVQIDGNLRRALANGELSLMYQPQFDMADGTVVGAEALLRWRHPRMGLVDPDRFVPIAEETGTIVPIGAWVLREACRVAQGWCNAGVPFERIAVNIAGPQIQRGDLVAVVERALEDSGLPPTRLELEVTESFIMGDAERSVDILRALRALGVRLAIDDFGTGYSSLHYLSRLPIDILKIDKSFIDDCTGDAGDAEICRAVVNLAASLELGVIAEGVETEMQRAFLLAAGCTRGQGYLFGEPVAAAEFPGMASAAATADGAGRRA